MTGAVNFTFDGKPYRGRAGQTLAAALLANGVHLTGRSFKYHRPRGIMTAGPEEPNALVEVGTGGRYEPNTRATDIFLYEGLTATSQNRWPSLRLDLGAVNQLIAPFIPAGFYYKTFLGSPKLWLLYERFIRAAAGLGRPPTQPDADVYEHRAAFCDVLVVGGGPAGIAAALEAAKAGGRVMLVEQDAVFGGGLLRDPDPVEGVPAADWIAAALETLKAAGVRILTRATAVGYWDHDMVTVAERLTEPGQRPGPNGLAQRLWRVRAGRVVLATGALERPLLFSGNDRPGVMLSQAVRSYIRRFGVLPGKRVVIATCADDAYRTALAVSEAGGAVVAVLDTRPREALGPAAAAIAAGLDVRFNAAVVQARGSAQRLYSVEALIGAQTEIFEADLLAVCGGFSPVAHLHMQAGGTLKWDAATGAFSPDLARQNQTAVGAAASLEVFGAISASFEAAPGVNLKTAFIDFQNDVTAGDVDLAWREGYRSVEHLKRYTTLGMATDQGKTSNITGLARLSANEGRSPTQVGTTTFRPPYTPVTLGTLAGHATGAHMAPLRRPALYDLHATRKPLWQPVGYWMRPRAYPAPGESLHHAAMREARAVRTTVGVTDVSTLGKFEVVGPDAAAFLEIVCATTVGKLAVGRGRYTFMLREDGLVMDDGTVWRLAETRFLLTSSTGGADRMAQHLSYVRRVLAPALRVSVVNVQERWSGIAVAGPLAKGLVESLSGDPAPRHMSCTPAVVAGTPVLILAASYSGERAFEVYADVTAIAPVWTALADGAQAAGGALYGLEALEFLRIEKGHVVTGGEVDGRTTANDLNLHKMLRPAGGYIGAHAQMRPALLAADRPQLVGLEALSGEIPEGSMLIDANRGTPVGHVTAACPRVLTPGSIALALLQGGRARLGETLAATSPTRGVTTPVRVVEPMFHDPEGARYRD